MRKKLLLSTAALLAGVAMASAQSMPGGGHSQTGAPGAEHQQSTQGHSGQAQSTQHQSTQGQAQRSEQAGQRETTGQAAGQKEQSTRQKSVSTRRAGRATRAHNGPGACGEPGRARQAGPSWPLRSPERQETGTKPSITCRANPAVPSWNHRQTGTRLSVTCRANPVSRLPATGTSASRRPPARASAI